MTDNIAIRSTDGLWLCDVVLRDGGFDIFDHNMVRQGPRIEVMANYVPIDVVDKSLWMQDTIAAEVDNILNGIDGVLPNLKQMADQLAGRLNSNHGYDHSVQLKGYNPYPDSFNLRVMPADSTLAASSSGTGTGFAFLGGYI